MTITAGRHRQLDGPTPEQEVVSTEASDPATFGWWVRTVVSWTALLAAVGLLAFLVAVPRLAGATPYTVLTGSMEPTISPGAVVVVKPTDAEDLRTGDVITFQPISGDPQVVTHRIDGIFYNSDGELRFTTKGDANNAQDSWALVPEQIRGRMWYSAPYLGHINSVIAPGTRSTLIYVLAGGLLVYAVWMVGSGVSDRRKENRRDASDTNKAGHNDELL